MQNGGLYNEKGDFARTHGAGQPERTMRSEIRYAALSRREVKINVWIDHHD
jgi:hypothetical protein